MQVINLIRQLRLISKFIMSSTVKQIIAIQLPNISRSKGNQKMKPTQLIIYNMRKSFFEKSYRKCLGLELAYIRINSLKFYTVFLLFFQLGTIKKY